MTNNYDSIQMIDTIKVGIKLKKLAKQHHISAPALARNMGISKQSVYKWYRGQSLPSIDNLFYLCQLYQISIDELLDYHPVKTPINFIKEEMTYYYSIN